jgi:hypothetical protein
VEVARAARRRPPPPRRAEPRTRRRSRARRRASTSVGRRRRHLTAAGDLAAPPSRRCRSGRWRGGASPWPWRRLKLLGMEVGRRCAGREHDGHGSTQVLARRGRPLPPLSSQSPATRARAPPPLLDLPAGASSCCSPAKERRGGHRRRPPLPPRSTRGGHGRMRRRADVACGCGGCGGTRVWRRARLLGAAASMRGGPSRSPLHPSVSGGEGRATPLSRAPAGGRCRRKNAKSLPQEPMAIFCRDQCGWSKRSY